MTPKEICERAAKGLIDVAIIPRGVESRLRGVELIEITRLDPVLVVPKWHRLARLSKIPPRILQNVILPVLIAILELFITLSTGSAGS
jgi:hypothetical protein